MIFYGFYHSKSHMMFHHHLGESSFIFSKHLKTTNGWFGARWFRFHGYPKMKGMINLLRDIPIRIQNHQTTHSKRRWNLLSNFKGSHHLQRTGVEVGGFPGAIWESRLQMPKKHFSLDGISRKFVQRNTLRIPGWTRPNGRLFMNLFHVLGWFLGPQNI